MTLVAIPVHQRGDLVRHCFATVAELELPGGSEVVVFDDQSPTLDVPGLVRTTRLVCRLERSTTRLGADGMVAHIWRHFLDSSHETLLFLDSDMIANRDAVTVGLRLAGRFDGLVSLYNSTMHPGTPLNRELLSKATVGNAGTFWSRRHAQLALDGVGNEVSAIDFAYCRLFERLGIPIATPTQSRLQHLGIIGFNNRYYGNLDHGIGFVPDAPAQWHAIGYVYNELMTRQSEFLRPPEPNWLSRWWRRG
ncbi:MAG TPA: glycosyltransferase [Devosia sp.]|uniref:glycosyltransferase family 2 protein n=1 Tax=Devosia sp. TaxID=1871048 RepID=UPI002DDD9F5D|nr:glycosyltransferase [Devosia sp.]HEV2518490.1 glycosyltransferase [Devosia sp.]